MLKSTLNNDTSFMNFLMYVVNEEMPLISNIKL